MSSVTKRFYFFALQVRLLYLYSLTLVGLALLGVLWWYFGYQSFQNSVEFLNQEIAGIYKKTVHKNKNECELQTIIKHIEQLHHEIEAYQSTKDVSGYSLALIMDLGLKHGLSIHSCRGQQEAIILDASGTFAQIVSLFESLEQDKQRVQCIKLSLVHRDGEHYALQAVLKAKDPSTKIS